MEKTAMQMQTLLHIYINIIYDENTLSLYDTFIPKKILSLRKNFIFLIAFQVYSIYFFNLIFFENLQVFDAEDVNKKTKIYCVYKYFQIFLF